MNPARMSRPITDRSIGLVFIGFFCVATQILPSQADLLQ